MTNEAGAMLLSTKDLTVGYGKKSEPLFEKLNLSLQAGKLVCFMGPNGIGKSSLIRVLAGLQKPLAGTVHYGNITQTDFARALAVVLTDKVRSAVMTVKDLVTFGRYPYLDWSLRLRPQDEMHIQNAIQQLRIEHLTDRKLYELSDGQLQMVMLAKALAQDTPILLLDEPTSHLDLNNRVEIMNLLRTVARQNHKAILVATHELDLALQTTDTIWLTGKNKTITTGIPEDLVLNNAFDDVFQFKGYDLKTGKIEHDQYRGKAIHLQGEGYAFLWTRNALERNGYTPSLTGEPSIFIKEIDGSVQWQLIVKDEKLICYTLHDLINSLGKLL